MSATFASLAPAAADPAVRAAIVRKLADVVSWPATRISASERQLAGDLLIGFLRAAPPDVRQRCAQRLVGLVDAPKPVLRYLARDEITVARELLERGQAFDDSDLVSVARAGQPPHWQAIARRKAITACVVDALLENDDRDVALTVVANPGAQLSQFGVDRLVRMTRAVPAIAAALLKRDELKASQAYALFWWSDAANRSAILRRFAVDREVLLAEFADVFALATAAAGADMEVRKALQFVERRQRSRAAAEASPYGSLEGAVAIVAERGLDDLLRDEIAHLCGVRPSVARQIFHDPGGEPIAILAKAVGLKRPAFEALWSGLARAGGAQMVQAQARSQATYDTLANAKAQTVLRYWNWALTSDSGAVADDAQDRAVLEFAPARQFASWVGGEPPTPAEQPAALSRLANLFTDR
jgi:uncharacterized protein (DUF2336 family)